MSASSVLSAYSSTKPSRAVCNSAFYLSVVSECYLSVLSRVSDAPSITYFTINERRASSVARENEPVTLNCRVSSMPPSTIQIYNGSTLISAMTSTLQVFTLNPTC